nr:unnamed protein product [Callosobruchus analis]
MSIDLKDDDIKLCYRVGSRETGKIRNRCVFLKLNNLDTKENVYGKKTFLKGTGIAVREDLTKNRVKLLNGAMEKVGLNNVWTVNGDFNIDLLNSTHATNLFSNLLDSSGLIQVIKEPTRVTKNSATLLDFILTSDNICISKVGSVPYYYISDHELVYVDVRVSRKKVVNNMKTYRDMKNMNLSVLYDELQSIPWRNVYDIDNIDGKVEFFNENITILMDRHAPSRTCNFTKPYKPWITSNITFLIKLQEKALIKFKRTRSAVDWERYKELKNHITFLIRSEKQAYLQHVTNKDKTFVWKALSNLKVGMIFPLYHNT